MQVMLSTFIKLPFVIKIFVLLIVEWPIDTGFTDHIHVKKFFFQLVFVTIDLVHLDFF